MMMSIGKVKNNFIIWIFFGNKWVNILVFLIVWENFVNNDVFFVGLGGCCLFCLING